MRPGALKLAMVGAVGAVFLLAYIDQQREQERALAEFTAEQAAFARVAAEALRGPFEHTGPRATAEATTELERALSGLQAAGEQSCALLFDGERWLSVDAQSAWRPMSDKPQPEVAQLLARMRGGAGSAILGREAAASLGLDRRFAGAGFAPVADGRWTVAVVTSARRVRDRARFAVWRLAATTTLAGLFVGLFGVVLARQQRRAQSLAQALHVAEATSALRERSEKMIEAIPIGVLSLDRQGRVSSVNPYLAERGARSGVALADALAGAQPVEIAELRALVDEAREKKAPTERLGVRLRLGVSGTSDVDALAIPLERPLADVECFLVLHDRTDVRRLERNLARAEKLATIGTLAAGVAHEVGTPLGIISGRAEQLLGRLPESDAAARKNVDSILGQVDKVSTTIRQLLDFARVRPIDAERVTPAQAVQNAAALLDHRFRHAGVALEIEAPPTLPTLSADPGQLEQVLVNLLINACDACSDGGHVRVRAAERGERVALEVRDDGIGIAPENLPRVLDPFFTTKKRGQGTGLGLSIAADIVKNHGGSLELESVVGEGTTIRVLLPRAEARS